MIARVFLIGPEILIGARLGLGLGLGNEETIVFLTGGHNDYGDQKSSEVFPFLKYNKCSTPPVKIRPSALFLTADRSPRLAVCNGWRKTDNTDCLVLSTDQTSWETNILDPLPASSYHAAVTLNSIGVYLIGGGQSHQDDETSEFLASGSTKWRTGPALPLQMTEPCLVAIAERRFLAIFDDNILEYFVQIINYPTSDDGWQDASKWPKLPAKRSGGFGCSTINDKVVIAGGFVSGSVTKSTEVLDLRTGVLRKANNLITQRANFQVVTITAHGVERALAMGGHDYSWYDDTVEQFDTQTLSWEVVREPLSVARGYFKAIALPRGMICHAAGDHSVWG